MALKAFLGIAALFLALLAQGELNRQLVRDRSEPYEWVFGIIFLVGSVGSGIIASAVDDLEKLLKVKKEK